MRDLPEKKLMPDEADFSQQNLFATAKLQKLAEGLPDSLHFTINSMQFALKYSEPQSQIIYNTFFLIYFFMVFVANIRNSVNHKLRCAQPTAFIRHNAHIHPRRKVADVGI